MQWQASQIQTFTRWINGFVGKRGLKIESLEADLKDGVILINLLEILTGKTIEKYYKAPKNKTYMIANHAMSLKFMGQHKLGSANWSPQDLADGKITTLMGLIWSLIRQFSLKGAGKYLPSKIELCTWCKNMVEGYRNIHFDGSAQSFQNGLIFCALIHKHDPSLLDYESLDFGDAVGNLRTALTIGEKIGMPHLLENHDVNEDFLDEKSLMAYLTEYYNLFQQRKLESASSKPRAPDFDPEEVDDDRMDIDKDMDGKLDIEKVAEKYLAQADFAPVSNEKMKAEIEQLHIQIINLTEDYETRLMEEKEIADNGIKIREEKIAFMEKKIEELEKHQLWVECNSETAIHEEWAFINEQKRIINNERQKLEQEKKKLAEEHDFLRRARQDIQKRKDEMSVEKEKFDKDKRALLVGDLKLIDFQGQEIAHQVQMMREEIRIAQLALGRLKVDDWDLSYLGVEFIDEAEEMEYYNDAWWEQQRAEMVLEEKLRLKKIILVQRQVRIWLAERKKAKQIRYALATEVIKRAILRWHAKRVRKVLLKYKSVIAEITITQSVVRRWMARRSYRMLLKRTDIARELLTTEISYVQRLESVVSVFIEPLKKLLTKEQMKAIFSELEVILGYNKMLLTSLKERMESWNTDTKIGDVFLKMTYFLKSYTQYVTNYNTAITTINSIKHNEKVAAFLMKCSKDSRCMGLDIGAFLILPVQRIPRYVMLLQDLFKFTPASHADFEDLSNSMMKMKHVADYVNEKKRDADNIHEVLTVQDKLVGKLESDLVLAQPHRRYMREGFLVDMKEKKKVYYFLFNDLLIGTKRKSQKPFMSSHSFKYLHRIPLTESTTVCQISGGKMPGFKISNEQSYSFYAVPQEETNQWFIDIQNAIDKLSSALRARTGSSAEPLSSSSTNPPSLSIPSRTSSSLTSSVASSTSTTPTAAAAPTPTTPTSSSSSGGSSCFPNRRSMQLFPISM